MHEPYGLSQAPTYEIFHLLLERFLVHFSILSSSLEVLFEGAI